MVFISMDELFTVLKNTREHHLSIIGLIGGMITMALSLFLFSNSYSLNQKPFS
jgi:ZIP family zinc transporter